MDLYNISSSHTILKYPSFIRNNLCNENIHQSVRPISTTECVSCEGSSEIQIYSALLLRSGIAVRVSLYGLVFHVSSVATQDCSSFKAHKAKAYVIPRSRLLEYAIGFNL